MTPEEKYAYNADFIRGNIIAQTIQLERFMDLFVAKYFMSKERFSSTP